MEAWRDAVSHSDKEARVFGVIATAVTLVGVVAAFLLYVRWVFADW